MPVLKVCRVPHPGRKSLQLDVSSMRTSDFIEAKIQQRPVLLIAKDGCPNSKTIEGILNGYQLNAKRMDTYEVLYIESRKDCSAIETYLWHKLLYKQRQVRPGVVTYPPNQLVPHLFVDGVHIGGFKEILLLYQSGKLEEMLRKAGKKCIQLL
ncbi:unnamed protein product [Dicrocoelium dendriticum]|nr:unnamed protein product [Dicrocoelium dendriticum]